MDSLSSNNNALVTGGTGSIGHALVEALLTRGVNRIVVFSRDEMKHFHLRGRYDDARVISRIGDVRDPQSLRAVCRDFGIDTVFHVAAMKHVPMCEDAPLQAVMTNVLGTQNMLDAVLNQGVGRMVTVSTDKAVMPVNVMGATKLLAERLTLNAALDAPTGTVISCVRFGNVWSSRGSVIPVWIDTLRRGQPLRITDPNVTRFAMPPDEAARLVLSASESADGGQIHVLKMKAFRLGDLLDVMRLRIAPRLGISSEDVRVIKTGLVPGEKLHERLLSDDELARTTLTDDAVVVHPRALEAEEVSDKMELNKWVVSDAVVPLTHDEIERVVLEYLDTVSC
ncbi:MAG: SDR family NAD(P)-dependent oxidoreductase [Dehalococcoidia bacterium]|nr:SDR family NAD(P)-dependent oxidoreductase [Dehalococcoidia bacterium]